jgi:hypothetical protein
MAVSSPIEVQSRLDRIVHLGRLYATHDFLALIPRPALSMALRTHQHVEADEGRAFETRHSFEGVLFRLRTSADRARTEFRLDWEP